jgi:hypothetical protein
VQVFARKKRLPAGALLHHASVMGVDAVGIVGLLGLLLGTTLGFQALVQLQRFGAGVFAADMISASRSRAAHRNASRMRSEPRWIASSAKQHRRSPPWPTARRSLAVCLRRRSVHGDHQSSGRVVPNARTDFSDSPSALIAVTSILPIADQVCR